jgi:hypothetical protein
MLWHAKRRKLDYRNTDDIRDKIKANRRDKYKPIPQYYSYGEVSNMKD